MEKNNSVVVPAATGKIQQNQAKKDDPLENKKISIDAISDEEIIRENLKEIFEKKSREERKANGRLVAVIVAFLVIFLAVYHAYIRKSAALTGILIPAAIMVSYGGWVVLLAKRDKQRRALFEKHLEEVALKNKHEVEMKNKAKHTKNSNEITLRFEDEITRNVTENQSSILAENVSGVEPRKHHRKHHRQRRAAAGGNSNSSNSSRQSSSHKATKDLRAKRPSLRQKFFRQNASNAVIMASNRSEVKVQAHKKKKRLQPLDALATPQLTRIGSVP